MIKYLIEKEFKQLFRNSFLPKLIFIFPCMIMILMPWAANLEIKNINLNVVDNDRSVVSRRLVDKLGASTYFRLTALPDTYDEALYGIEAGTADVILEIPRDFEKDWINGKAPRLLVAANAVNGTKGSLGGSYLSAIIGDYTRELKSEMAVRPLADKPLPRIGISTLNLYNPTLNYKLFMVPALMVMLLTLICGFLPALNVVGEKEAGTIEQINVTPVGKFTFITAKLIPYWIIGLLVLTLAMVIAWVAYGLVPVGSIWIIYVVTLLFSFVMSGLGVSIANCSSTMQQSMYVMFFFIIIFQLMSGLMTPIDSMPQWAQYITYVIPPRYFIEIMRSVYLKGSMFSELWQDFSMLAVFAVFVCLAAMITYKKQS